MLRVDDGREEGSQRLGQAAGILDLQQMRRVGMDGRSSPPEPHVSPPVVLGRIDYSLCPAK